LDFLEIGKLFEPKRRVLRKRTIERSVALVSMRNPSFACKSVKEEGRSVFFDDLPLGKKFETGTRVLDRDDIVRFAREWDPQPFHLDDEAAKASPYGGIIASGFHTILVAFNLVLAASDWSQSSMGSPGMANIEWIKPVYVGDTIMVRSEVVSARASRTKPDRGFVELQNDIYNQHGVLVARYRGMHMLRKRPQAA
jgi:acyl dehydratase